MYSFGLGWRPVCDDRGGPAGGCSSTWVSDIARLLDAAGFSVGIR